MNTKVTPIYLTFLNYLAGYEYFLFLAEKEFQLDISGSGTTKKNIFPEWPKTWGQTADTIERKTFTNARYKTLVRSQHLTENQRDALVFIKTSPVVQIVVTRTDRRTVIVDSDSYKIFDEKEGLFTIQFYILHTDEIPTQRA
jgi:hypothetical protein